jgi:spermidine synthase
VRPQIEAEKSAAPARKAIWTLRVVLSLIGFTAIIAQIVLMRELMVVFYGNEISLGLMLASWLLWTAIGSSLFGRLSRRLKPRALMAGLQVLISLAFPITILAVRASRGAFQPIAGEILGPGPMFLTSLATLSVLCALSGWSFAAGSRLYAAEMGTSIATGTGSVYLLEAAGSGLGGLLASLLFIRYLTSFEIAAVVALLNLLAAASLLIRAPSVRRAAMAALAAVFAFVVYPMVVPRLEAISLARLWQGFRLVVTRNSVYGNLAVVGTEDSRSLYENGLVVFTVPDREAAEEAVHFALLEHPSPRRLLLIGGGVAGGVAEALKHPSVERVDYVELDPTILDLAGEYFRDEWTPARADPRVSIHNLDGRLFLKTTQFTFDVIIVRLPDPQTAQLNRFYTVEFFREAAQKLRPGGILSFQVTGAENYISAELAEFLRCLNQTLRRVFPEVAAIPGASIHFFAANRAGVLTTDPEVLAERLRARNLQTMYVREYYFPFRMMPDRMQDLESQMQPGAGTPVNRDFAPIAYYFDVALWSSRFHQRYRQWFESVARIRFAALLLCVAVALSAFTVLAWWWSRPKAPGRERSDASPPEGRRQKIAAALCVAAMGFTLIGLEILLLLGFQAIYGYVYHQLALVIAAFMVGMAAGSWRGLRRSGEANGQMSEALVARTEIRWLTGLQIAAAASPLLLYLLFVSVAGVESSLGLFLVSQILFPALALLSGMLGGYQFPLASRIYFAGAERSTRSPGTLYALDLLGAALGAVLLSAYLFPVFGFLKAALLMAAANLAPAALASAIHPGRARVVME